MELIHENQKGSKRRRQKSWVHYEDLSFLKNHVEIYRLADLADQIKDVDDNSENYREFEGNKIVLLDEDTDEKDIYEIQIRNEDDANFIYKDVDDENQLIEETTNGENAEEEDEEEDIYLLESTLHKQDTRNENVSTTMFTTSNHPEKSLDEIESSGASRVITDPDERYLMSCLPTFKRFNAQQKAYVRMAIEKLFYEVEFEDASDPKNKRLRMN